MTQFPVTSTPQARFLIRPHWDGEADCWTVSDTRTRTHDVVEAPLSVVVSSCTWAEAEDEELHGAIWRAQFRRLELKRLRYLRRIKRG